MQGKTKQKSKVKQHKAKQREANQSGAHGKATSAKRTTGATNRNNATLASPPHGIVHTTQHLLYLYFQY
jgi:hypothetical protein